MDVARSMVTAVLYIPTTLLLSRRAEIFFWVHKVNMKMTL